MSEPKAAAALLRPMGRTDDTCLREEDLPIGVAPFEAAHRGGCSR
jgi:hypothetical protein